MTSEKQLMRRRTFVSVDGAITVSPFTGIWKTTVDKVEKSTGSTRKLRGIEYHSPQEKEELHMKT